MEVGRRVSLESTAKTEKAFDWRSASSKGEILGDRGVVSSIEDGAVGGRGRAKGRKAARRLESGGGLGAGGNGLCVGLLEMRTDLKLFNI